MNGHEDEDYSPTNTTFDETENFRSERLHHGDPEPELEPHTKLTPKPGLRSAATVYGVARSDRAGMNEGAVVGNGEYQDANFQRIGKKPDVRVMSEPTDVAGFAHIDGDLPGQGTGFNDTLVDVIAVPCPGADPVRTWICDPLPDDYFGNPSSKDTTRHPTLERLAYDALCSPAIGQHIPKAAQAWIKQGIRLSKDSARVMLYRHASLTETTTLEDLAKDLLGQVLESRRATRQSRPIFFIAHSIGGLVAKLAIVRASQIPQYRQIMYNCHGITFFATPHRGSSYLSMKSLRESIRKLLHLRHPLPASLTNELRVNYGPLITIHNEFVAISSELRIWTFYETIESPLSGNSNAAPNTGVQFGAPLVSIKSALLDVRQEEVFSVDSDHGNLASFGPANTETMHTFIKDLTKAISHAEEISQNVHTPLKLKEHVKVELVGFYDDPVAETDSTIRLYSTKYHLGDFLAKGPERCLEERLRQVPKRPGTEYHPRYAPPPSFSSNGSEVSGTKNHLGIWNNVQKMWTSTDGDSVQSSLGPNAPDIVVTDSSTRPPLSSRAVPGIAITSLGLQPPHFQSRYGGTRTMSEPSLQFGLHDTETSAWTQPMDKDGAALSTDQRSFLLSRAHALQDYTSGFSRPNPALRKFTWIHTPYTNPIWVKSIFETLSRTHNLNFSRLFDKDNWLSKHNQGSQSQAQPAFVTPSCDYVYANPLPSPRLSPSFTPQGAIDTTPNSVYLFLPYLHFDTYCNIVRRRKIIAARMRHGRASPVPPKIAERTESLESRIVWKYLGHDPPLNWRRTLDQFGYPSLGDTNARDDDQMLYKLTKQEPNAKAKKRTWVPTRHSLSSKVSLIRDGHSDSSDSDDSDAEEENYLRDGKLLMVDQLWLWTINTDTLTTFFPKRESNPKEGTLFQQADLRNSVYNELNGDLTGRTENALDLAAFVALHAVTVFLDKASHPDLDIFPIFEEAIGLLAERMTSNMKQFRTQSIGSTSDDDRNSVTSIKKRHKRELARAERENRENTSALLELRDMEDELGTLQKLFKIQRKAIVDMRRIYNRDELKGLTVNGIGYLDDAIKALIGYQQQTSDMEKRVETTRKDYEKMLEMAQRQAQVDEVRWSRLQTELASSQNLSVMIFTTFTVIFLPLSFFTSLFGMNTEEWDLDLPSVRTVGRIALPSSFMLILLSLLAAFSSRVQRLCKLTFDGTKDGIRTGISYLGKLQPRPIKKRKRKRRLEQEEERLRRVKEREKERGFDLWGVIKQQGTMEYQIPTLNRKRTKQSASRGW